MLPWKRWTFCGRHYRIFRLGVSGDIWWGSNVHFRFGQQIRLAFLPTAQSFVIPLLRNCSAT
jgi:hypothetical protein